jgi:hypothetical protein
VAPGRSSLDRNRSTNHAGVRVRPYPSSLGMASVNDSTSTIIPPKSRNTGLVQSGRCLVRSKEKNVRRPEFKKSKRSVASNSHTMLP